MTLAYPFTQEESQKAYDAWGANCGPNALAFALQVSLDAVRPLIPGFGEKRYTSPTMMKSALAKAGVSFDVRMPDPSDMYHAAPSLVRIQWTGPWTAEGANPKWAYRQTHWIASWRDTSDWIFDCNGGIQSPELWRQSIVPAITSQIPRADGRWFPTHVWRLAP